MKAIIILFVMVDSIAANIAARN